MSELWNCRLGLMPYDDALALQEHVRDARQDERIPDVVLAVEHPPTYTRGRRTDDSELPMGVEWYRAQGIEVRDTDRGGRLTYHGPGQLVVYPIIGLRALQDDVLRYVRMLESVVVDAVGAYGVDAGTRPGLTGVWTAGERKIGSIGIHVSRGVTTHGLAVNVSNDLQPFEWVVPCGIDHCRMTSLTRETGRGQDADAFADTLLPLLAAALGADPVDVGPGALAQSLPEAQPA
jgi:lipoyl(octanoyl) transferase